jgi:hypothetical protein
MSKKEQSIEKQLVIHGIIIDWPSHSGYGVSDWLSPDYDSKFLLELNNDVSTTFKRSEPVNLKAGEKIIVKCSKECYLRFYLLIPPGNVWIDVLFHFIVIFVVLAFVMWAASKVFEREGLVG